MKIFRITVFASLLLTHLPAHATSFDCNKGRSITEQLICHRADLSKLDDVLGKLYWQARRSVSNPKAFRADSDSKWAWREANCSDEECLRTWYTGRIQELQLLLTSLQQEPSSQPDKSAQPVTPVPRDAGRREIAHAQPGKEERSTPLAGTALGGTPLAHAPSYPLALQCTAANPGVTWHDQCATVLKQDTRWQYPPHSGDWFCGVATVEQSPAEPVAQQ
ncbi:hypothetical protein [Paraburkholderia sp.]|jgi:uncharacterized protein YecT (DUF1311 family)|uniref:lysozyme inhibitor LprI family protein n=1 Tax=Paraburkholderia sp. TaxID=1926495 RepID=UPI002603FAF3|nr:hypothetical protein [Paraburkholderia sp.]